MEYRSVGVLPKSELQPRDCGLDVLPGELQRTLQSLLLVSLRFLGLLRWSLSLLRDDRTLFSINLNLSNIRCLRPRNVERPDQFSVLRLQLRAFYRPVRNPRQSDFFGLLLGYLRLPLRSGKHRADNQQGTYY
jgi:hypothetical protein